jgi:hypothetical protein
VLLQSPKPPQSEKQLRAYRESLGLPPALWATGAPIPLSDVIIASTQVRGMRARVRTLYVGGHVGTYAGGCAIACLKGLSRFQNPVPKRSMVAYVLFFLPASEDRGSFHPQKHLSCPCMPTRG